MRRRSSRLAASMISIESMRINGAIAWPQSRKGCEEVRSCRIPKPFAFSAVWNTRPTL